MAFLAGCICALAVFLGPRAARAGNPITDIPRVEDGAGVKVGQHSSFHPGIAVMGGFDSNVFNQSKKSEGIRRAGFVMPSVWAGLGNRRLQDGVLDSPPKPTARRLDYYVGLIAGWRLYLHGVEAVRQAGKLNLGADVRLHIAPGRRFQVDIDDTFRRLGEPRNFEIGREYNYNHLENTLILRTTTRPGGGRLGIGVGARFELLYFETPALLVGNRIVVGPETELKYRVRDRSAFAVRYSYLFDYYYSCCAEPGTGRNEDSHNHRVLAGYAGQIGKKWALDAFGGWGAGLYKDDQNGPNHENLIGHLGIAFFPTMRTRIQLMFSRYYHDSVFGNYFSDLGGNLFAEHVFRTRTRLALGFGVVSRRTSGLPIPGEDTQDIVGYTNAAGFVRKDLLVTGHAQLEQPLGKYFVVGARYLLAVDRTDFVAEYAGGTLDYGGFVRHVAMAIVAVRY